MTSFLNRDEEGRLATINALGNPPLWITGGPQLRQGKRLRPEQVWTRSTWLTVAARSLTTTSKPPGPLWRVCPALGAVGRLIGHLGTVGPGMSLETEVLGNLGPLIACYEDVFAHRVGAGQPA